MKILESNTEKDIIYFFENMKVLGKEKIEAGKILPTLRGEILETLPISLNTKNHENNSKLMVILKDCIPMEFSKDFGQATFYLESIKVKMKSLNYDGKGEDETYVHTIRKSD